ncbi:MAG: ribose-phosphate pyrophosphokinase [Pseudohongiellaceae bacterium]
MLTTWHRLFSLHEDKALARRLRETLGLEKGRFDMRHFPDGESYLRILDDVKNHNVVVLADLYQPDRRILPLLLLAETLRDLGAKAVLLVVPYLPYMRQDKRFHHGEGVTSRYFATLLSRYFSALVTIDPHLHRYHGLSEIYDIPTRVGHAAPLIAEWITANVDKPVLIGPDSESEQWVAAVAKQAGAPFTVLSKTRHADRDVEVSVPQIERWLEHTPVLVDDIISSGHTMLETLSHLERLGLPRAVCIGVHGVFAESADEKLTAVAQRVVTSNAIPHPTNAIDIGGLLAANIRDLA